MKPKKGKSAISAKTEKNAPQANSGYTTTATEGQQPKKDLKDEGDEEVSDKEPIIGPEIVSSIFDIDLKKILKPSFEVPKLHRMSHAEGIELLGELLGMYDLEYNLISYWTLEVLSEVIKKAQSKCMNEVNQKMSIIWIVYVLMKISLHHPGRKNLFKHLCLLFIRGSEMIPTLLQLPNPFALHYAEEELERELEEEAEEEEFLDIPSESLIFNESVSNTKMSERTLQEEDENSNTISQLLEEEQEQIQLLSFEVAKIREENDRDFYQLIKMIYRIFANRFKYAVIWEAFTNPPSYKTFIINDDILVPKISVMYKPPQKDRGSAGRSAASTKSKFKSRVKATVVKSKVSLSQNKLARKKRSVLKMGFMKTIIDAQKEKEMKMRMLSKHIRPLREAVNNKFFHWIAGSLFKENLYKAYQDEIESVRVNLELEEKDPEKVKRALQLFIDEHASKVGNKKKKSETTVSKKKSKMKK